MTVTIERVTRTSFGVKFTVCLPPARGDDKARARSLTELTPADAERIAIALSAVLKESDRKNGLPPRNSLYSDWVEIAKEREAGTFTVTVVNRDVMAMVRPYSDPKPGDLNWPPSIRKPMLFGYRLDGRKYYRRIDEHGQLIGLSTGGKSSLIQCIIAYATLCAERNQDVVIWVAGEHKLFDLLMGWTEPLLGTGRRCPIDWAVKGYDDSMEMLTAVRRIAQYRQSARGHNRGGWPHILLILDEISSLVEHHKKAVMFDGVPMFPDTITADIVRFDTQGDVNAVIATQDDVHAVLGDKGGTLQKQIKYSAMFQINDSGDGAGRQLGNYQLTAPRFSGEYWIKDSETGLPVRLKAPYPQSSDPRKEILHNGLTVADIARSRTMPDSYGLDAESAQIAGLAYLRRSKVVTEEFIDYLRGVKSPIVVQHSPTQQQPPADPTNEGLGELADAESDLAGHLRKLIELGEELPEEMTDFLVDYAAREPQPAPQATGGAPVLSLVGRQSWADRILAVLTTSPGATRGEIIEGIEASGHAVRNPNLVSNELGRLVRAGRLHRDGTEKDGRYTITGSDHTHVDTHEPLRGV